MTPRRPKQDVLWLASLSVSELRTLFDRARVREQRAGRLPRAPLGSSPNVSMAPKRAA
ncbi:MAG: hypothetical protein U0263_03160 [Polyangiaceae bacterium]